MPDVKTDVTDRVERMTALEDRFGIEIEAVYASFAIDDWSNTLTVNFDVVGRSGELDSDVKIMVSAYNGNGQLIGTTSEYLNADDFLAIESCSASLDCDTAPSRIRIMPKKR